MITAYVGINFTVTNGKKRWTVFIQWKDARKNIMFTSLRSYGTRTRALEVKKLIIILIAKTSVVASLPKGPG